MLVLFGCFISKYEAFHLLFPPPTLIICQLIDGTLFPKHKRLFFFFFKHYYNKNLRPKQNKYTQTRRAITAVREWRRVLGTKTGFRAAKNKENKGQFKLKLIFIRYFWVSLSVFFGKGSGDVFLRSRSPAGTRLQADSCANVIRLT